MRALRLAPIVQNLLLKKVLLKASDLELTKQIDELDRRHRRIESFVAGFAARPVNSLFKIICGHYSECDGEVCFKGYLSNAFYRFRSNVLVVRCLTANHDTQTNHCVVFVTHRRALGSHRQLKGTWDTNDRDGFF